MKNNWSGPVNQLLFGLTYAHDITDELVDFFADSAVHRTTLGLGADVYYEAIEDALSSGENLSNAQLPQFDHSAIAEFLRAVATRLDALRPWIEPRFRRLDPTAWLETVQPTAVARLMVSINDATAVLRERFDPVGDPQQAEYVLMIALDTGETVALVGSYAPDKGITLMSENARDAALIVEHFLTATGFPADKVHVLEVGQ